LRGVQAVFFRRVHRGEGLEPAGEGRTQR
jgi:hypothetical protein